jgi:anti-sigma factor RsiW
MTCNEIKELTVPYLELDLEPSRVRDVTTHLEGCAGCRAEMEAVRQVLVRVKGMAVPDPGEQFWKEFPNRVRREIARQQPSVRRTGNVIWAPGWSLAIAASLLLVVIAWLLHGQFDEATAPAPSVSQPDQSVKTVASQPRRADRGQDSEFATVDLPTVVDEDWLDYWEVDPDAALIEMAGQLDRQAMDRLFTDI